jgi:hypothetical protein
VKKSILSFLVVFFVTSGVNMAHSINFETEKREPLVIVKTFFSRTSPLVNASVMIYAPDETQPYQTGRTDKSGYFAFMPNAVGNWTFAIDDERGHKDRLVISIDQGFFNGDDEIVGAADTDLRPEEAERQVTEVVVEKNIPGVYRVIFGLAVILGITGIFYGIKARKAIQKNSG